MFERIGQWFDDYIAIPGVPWWAEVLIFGFVMALISIAVTAVALLLVPVDYFAGPIPPAAPHRHPIVHWTLRILRNVVGWLLVGLGILLSFPGVPGQGVLTILLGVMLAEFPGKRTTGNVAHPQTAYSIGSQWIAGQVRPATIGHWNW